MESDKSSHQSEEAHPLRVPLGPSPWGFVNRTVNVAGNIFRFVETGLQKEGLSFTSLQNSKGTTLLIFDFYCYIRILDNGTALIWREIGSNLVFECFSLSSLIPLKGKVSIAKFVHENKIGYSPLPASQRWEVGRDLLAEMSHPLDFPYDWSQFGETLVLANLSVANGCDKIARAILVFNWSNKRVEVFPQDWFNQGDYDFGYQWVTRVARRSDGVIVGDGIRLGSFELDESNRLVKKWLSQNPFTLAE